MKRIVIRGGKKEKGGQKRSLKGKKPTVPPADLTGHPRETEKGGKRGDGEREEG